MRQVWLGGRVPFLAPSSDRWQLEGVSLHFRSIKGNAEVGVGVDWECIGGLTTGIHHH